MLIEITNLKVMLISLQKYTVFLTLSIGKYFICIIIAKKEKDSIRFNYTNS